MTSNEIMIDGQLLDLDTETQLLPTFQANDLTQPDRINSDYSPEFTAPFTTRNHQALGQAAVGTSSATRAYARTAATLRSKGVETMPRAQLIVKGCENQRYQLQLVAGNKRFVEALGTRKLADLDLSRFEHRWTADEVAARISADYYAANGWSYELFDRGKPLQMGAVLFSDCYPCISAHLLWQQILAETGFTASDWESELLDRLKLPATKLAEYSQSFRDARKLVASIGPGHERSGQPSSDRDTILVKVPYDDVTRRPNYHLPTVPGVYNLGQTEYCPDEAIYLDGSASATVRFLFSDIRLGKGAARLLVYVNDQPVLEGEEITVDNDTPFVVSVPIDGLLVGPTDRVTIYLRLRGVAPLVGPAKWGYRIFQDAFFSVNGSSLPPDKWQMTVRPTVPPGGIVRLTDWLPDLSLLDFFKALVQMGGLSVQTDGYEDALQLRPAGKVVDNAVRALDWTAKRDQPTPQPGQARALSFRFGSYGQRNYFKWAADETVTAGYGDGVLLVADQVLPKEYTLTTLPFAATEDSKVIPGLLRLPGYVLRFQDDPFAVPAYDVQDLQPRVVLDAGTTRAFTLRAGPLPAPLAPGASQAAQDQYNRELAAYNQAYDVAAPESYFASTTMPVELDAQRYILPVCWRSLRAMLTETRFLTERYRITPAEIQALDYTIPIWDAALGDYFAISKISEYNPDRATDVQMARLHPSFLPAPVPSASGMGQEHDSKEFYNAEYY